MAKWEIRNVNIAGVAMAVPEHTVKTAEIDLFSAEEAEIFDKTVGIKSRHIAPDSMCASDMCQAAGEKLLEELGLGQNKFEERCGISRGTIAHSKGDMSSANLFRIANAYPEVNIEWLVSGIGEKFKDVPVKSYTDGIRTRARRRCRRGQR